MLALRNQLGISNRELIDELVVSMPDISKELSKDTRNKLRNFFITAEKNLKFLKENPKPPPMIAMAMRNFNREFTELLKEAPPEFMRKLQILINYADLDQRPGTGRRQTILKKITGKSALKAPEPAPTKEEVQDRFLPEVRSFIRGVEG